jgi:hypothetical protein
VFGAAVPETPANVNCDLGRSEHDVNAATRSENDGAMDAIAKSSAVKLSPEGELRSGVSNRLLGHFQAFATSRIHCGLTHCASIADVVDPTPPDSALDEVEQWWHSQPNSAARLQQCVRTAMDEVIDTARTGRYSIDQLNPQEKAYIGTKVEIVIRSEFELASPGPGHKDYLIAGHEVDCKWSTHWGSWSIPTEQHGHLCLLVHADDDKNELAVGLMRTLAAYLNPGKNKDSKSTISAAAREAHARWLIPRSPTLPVNFLLHLPDDDRSAILDAPGGVNRAFELFRRCEGIIITRHVMASVGQQRDDARRFRGGAGGVRSLLAEHGWEVLNGTFIPQRERAKDLGGPVPAKGETVSLHRDGRSADRARERLSLGEPLQLF